MTEETKRRISGFDNVIRVLANEDKNTFLRVANSLFRAAPEEITRYDYDVDGKTWSVWESPGWKTVCDAGKTYNEFFDKETGFTCRFGRTVKEDPDYCRLGPSIADIEIVAGKCPKVNGKNCAFCYKSNGGETANCMTLAEFKELLDFLPKNLCQIAFGITGYYTNPDFPAMIEYAKSKGVVCNYTTNGVDLDEKAITHTVDNCGRIAVSCYEGAKDICYRTLSRVGEIAAAKGKKFPCNIHVVLSKATFGHVMSVLEDAKDGKIANLGAIVILRIKPVGRAANLDCVIPDEMYDEIVRYCFDNKIRFGFDSCGAKKVADVLVRLGKTDLISCVEPCESSRFSSYWNWKREYWNCSFCENNKTVMEAADMFRFNDFQSFWNSDEIRKVRFPEKRACASCPWYSLD